MKIDFEREEEVFYGDEYCPADYDDMMEALYGYDWMDYKDYQESY